MSVTLRRLLFWGLIGLLLMLGLGFAFWPRALAVDLVELRSGPLVVTVDEEGETRVRDVFVLSAPIPGRALRIDLEAGDAVTADETVVAQIEPSDPAFLDVRTEAQAEAAVGTAEAGRRLAVAEVEMAAAELDFAEAELERARELIQSRHISKRSLEDAERRFRTATASLETARAALRMRESELQQARSQLISPVEAQRNPEACDCVDITAPVSGRILRVLHESEGVVEAGQALAEIGDPRDLEVVADFLSEDAVKIRTGQRVILDEWGGPEPLTGRVQRVEPFGFTKVSALGIEEQRVNVVIDLSDPPERWARLGHGFRVEVRVVLWEGESVLSLPLTALFRNGETWHVFALEDGRARLREVEIGQRTGLAAEIRNGLSEGAMVVLHPSEQIAEGVKLTSRD